MAVYSFLTKEMRGGVIWEFSLAAYDQFFVNRGLFGDEPATLEWTYIAVFWRSIVQALVADFGAHVVAGSIRHVDPPSAAA